MLTTTVFFNPPIQDGDMPDPPLNIDYWASLYPAFTEYAEQYEVAMEYSTVTDRANHLWEWKGLNRSVPFTEISPVIDRLGWDDYLSKDRKAAIEAVSSELKEAGVVKTTSLVTSAFLLHLAASAEQYSPEYPIYDSRVWNAYVYLWRLRDTDEQLYAQASQDTAAYDNFCTDFAQTCPDGKAQAYERALFMFGRFIANLPPKGSATPIERIDEHLEKQERSLAERCDGARYILVDTEHRQR